MSHKNKASINLRVQGSNDVGKGFPTNDGVLFK